MTVWIYTDANKPEGDVARLKVFATSNAANEWFKIHDPEGVAFEYDVIQFIPAGSADKFGVPRAEE